MVYYLIGSGKSAQEIQFVPLSEEEVDPLVNFCFLNNADNQKIKDKAPSDYVSLMNPDSIMEILESAICPKDTFTMTYEEFVEARTKLLLSYANELISG